MDSGRVAEFDTPEALFERRGKFYKLCERSGISRDQLSGARRAAGQRFYYLGLLKIAITKLNPLIALMWSQDPLS
jgi:hypothetical protein